MKEKNEEEKRIDIKGTLEEFIEEEKPELSQEDAIKAYKNNDIIEYPKKKKKASDDEEENEDDEHLKRVKKELLASLERVNTLEKKIFAEKDKENLKDIKIKSGSQKSKNREQVIEQMRAKVQEENEKTRE
jgi:hypothetical protein